MGRGLPYSELICGTGILRKKFNISEETIDKLNAISCPNPLSKEDLKALTNASPNIARETVGLKPIDKEE